MNSHAWRDRTIGLLGGSFNPAHEGHLHLSLCALKSLKLDAVWWLVSPHNPLKHAADLAPYEARIQSAQRVACHPRIVVSNIERRLGTRYSIDTIRALKRRFPGARFVFLMGSDNLAQLHRWKRWTVLLTEIPIAVFDRAPLVHRALRAKPAQRMHQFMIKNNQITSPIPPRGWVRIPMRLCPLSATQLRREQNKKY